MAPSRTKTCARSNARNRITARRAARSTIEWKKGLFVPVQGATGLDKMAADAKADDVFVSILKRLTAQGRPCSPNPGPTYAPAVFAQEPAAKEIRISKKPLVSAMSRLLAENVIRIETSGPPSRQRSKIVLAGPAQ